MLVAATGSQMRSLDYERGRFSGLLSLRFYGIKSLAEDKLEAARFAPSWSADS